MKKTTTKNKLLTALLTLCMVLSLVPISAYADGVNYISRVSVVYGNINYKAGETPYATASVGEGNCTVAYEYWRELYQSEEGGVWRGTGRYWYSDTGKMASLSEDKRITQFEAGHCYSYNIVLVTDSGYFFSDDETVVSVGEYEWGTPGAHTNLEIKEMSTELHIYSIYSVDLPDESQTSTVSAATIENVKFDYQAGDAPQSTATVAAADADKYEIAYECWQQFENNNPVAAWYSDNGAHGSLPTITEFENDKTYVYSIMLNPKDGYSFSGETVITVNGENVTAPFVGGSMYIPAVKTITPTKQTGTITNGDSENTNVDYQAENAPQASATTPEYKIIEGANGSWTQNSDGTLKVVANGDFSRFTGIKVDGALVAADMYTAVSGSTVITLKKDYLDTLSAGRHTLTVVYSDGECSTEVEIRAAQSVDNTTSDELNQGNTETPKTGDSSNLMGWVALLFISGGAVISTTIVSKKKKYNS